jgi:hypothetical protein
MDLCRPGEFRGLGNLEGKQTFGKPRILRGLGISEGLATYRGPRTIDLHGKVNSTRTDDGVEDQNSFIFSVLLFFSVL